MFNIASLLFGLTAWALGVAAIVKKSVRPVCSGLSFSACGVSLLLQLYEVRRRVRLSDWSALLDTVDFLVEVAAILMCVTFLLNAAAWVRQKLRG